MKILLAISLITLLSCSAEPEPLQYGEDACHHCKMTLVDKKFGGELVTRKGKVYKFDDVNCMLHFYNSGEVQPVEFAHTLVVDFSTPAALIEASNAFFLKSANIKSPMASHVAAFQQKKSMDDVKQDLKGIYLVWGEIVTQFK